MKLEMDEKLKHRLIGLAVIISLAAIFAPAMMRKSSQHLDSNFSVNIKLPPKPVAPNVAVTDEKELFKTIKVARVRVPAVPAQPAHTTLTKAEPISARNSELAAVKKSDNSVEKNKLAVLKDTAKDTANHALQIAARSSSVQVAAKKLKTVKPSNLIPIKQISKTVYAVQVASFSQLTNAQSLVSRLKSKGYKANYVKVSGRKGVIYKVYAGHSPDKNQAMKVKTQLASAMRLKGFVVTTGVS